MDNRESKINRSLAGRDGELTSLREFLAKAVGGEGQAVIVTGEPGIGKTRLVDEFLGTVGGARVLRGHATEGDVRPFGAFSDALADVMGGRLFQEDEYTGFGSVFLINESGMLLAKSGGSDDMDADIFAGMLSAVQNFVSDSFDSTGHQAAGLGKLVYGDMTIMTEHAPGIFITAVAKGKEHPQMRAVLAGATREMCETRGEALASWTGNMADLGLLQESIDALARSRFLVRKDLEGVKFENERLRIAENVMAHVDGLTEKQPVVLMLEDVHWADESSLFLFSYIARNIKNRSLLLIATAREEGGQDFARFRSAVKEEETVSELNLAGLDKDGVRSLADRMFQPNEFQGDFIARLARDSTGNPLFIIETLRQMAEDGGIIQERGAYHIAREDYQLPGSVEEVVGRRLDTLDARAVAVAEYASCIGENFNFPDLASLSSLGDPGPEVEKLKKSGVFAAKDAGLGFSHAMFRQVTYETISGRWKTVYHRNLGEYCERTREARGGDAVYELARHFSASGDNPKAFGYLLEAGERAEGAYAAELARGFYGTALDIMPKLGAGYADDGVRAQILEKLADSERRVGAVKESAADYERAIAILDGDQRLAVTLKAANAIHLAGELDRAKEILGGILPLDDCVSNDVSTQILARYSVMCAGMGDKEAAGMNAELALKKLDAVKDPSTRVIVLTMLGKAYEMLGPEEKAQAMLQNAVDEAEASNDLGCLALAYSEIGYHKHFGGEHEAASKLLEKAAAYMEKRGDISELSRTLVMLGMAYSDCGELEKSLASLKRALAFARKMGNTHHLASTLGNIGYTLAMMGRHTESLAYQTESLELRRKNKAKGGMGWSYLDMSMVHVQLDMLDVAAECLTKSAGLFAESGDLAGLCMAKSALADIRKFQNDNAAAVSLYKEALAIAEQKNLARLKFAILKEMAELGAAEPVGALAELEAIAEKLADAPINMALMELRGNLAYANGNNEEAELHYDAGLKMATGHQIDDDLVAANLLVRRARLHWKTGRKEAAHADAARARELYGKWGRMREAKHVEDFPGE